MKKASLIVGAVGVVACVITLLADEIVAKGRAPQTDTAKTEELTRSFEARANQSYIPSEDIFPAIIPNNPMKAVSYMWVKVQDMNGAVTNMQASINTVTNALPVIEQSLPVISNMTARVVNIETTMTNVQAVADNALQNDFKAMTNSTDFVDAVKTVAPGGSGADPAKLTQLIAGLEVSTNAVIYDDMSTSELKTALIQVLQGLQKALGGSTNVILHTHIEEN